MAINYAAWSDLEWNIEQRQPVRSEDGYTPIKYGMYAVSFLFTEMVCLIDLIAYTLFSSFGYQRQWSYYNQIEDKLYLGAIPVKKPLFGRDDTLELRGKVQAVLSVVEPFENHCQGVITSPIAPEEWRRQGVYQLQIPTPDFETINLDVVKKGVAFIDWNIKNNRSVYVHCKAGRGRSALIVVCYLMQKHQLTLEAAFKMMKNARSQVSLGQDKLLTARMFKSTFKPIRD